jgi:hypothetical protein
MKLLQLKEDIENGRNLMFYKKDVYNYFKQLKNEYLCVYYNEPLPVKMRLVDAMYALDSCLQHSSNKRSHKSFSLMFWPIYSIKKRIKRVHVDNRDLIYSKLTYHQVSVLIGTIKKCNGHKKLDYTKIIT